jgi:adenylate cyclase
MLNLSKSISSLVLVLILHFYFYQSTYVKNIDSKIYDYSSIFFSKIYKDESAAYSVVVDIDEKSIQAFGQWPWPRVLNAELITMIHQMEPSAIGINILFPEKDRVSPLSIQAFYKQYFDVEIDLKQFPLKLHNNDLLLAKSIEKTNATLPIYLQNQFTSLPHCQEMRYHQNIFSENNSKIYGEEVLCNHPEIQKNIENFGFINAWADSDGVFRRVPLFMKYKEQVFPSFALATLFSFYPKL